MELTRRTTTPVAATRPPSPATRPGGRLQLASVACAGLVVVVLGATRGPLVAVAALAVAIIGLWTVERPEVIGYVLVAVVPATSGLQRGLVVPQLRLSEALVLVGAAIVLPRAVGDPSRRWSTLDWAAFGFVACHVVVGLGSGVLHHSLGGDGIRLLVGPVQFFLLYRTVTAVITTVPQRTRALEVLIAVTIPVSIITLLQASGVGGVQQVIEQTTSSEVFERWGWVESNRATGPFASWHPLAGYLFLPIVVSTAALTRLSGETNISRPLLYVSLPLAVAALLASQTLNVIAGIVLATLIIAVTAGRFVRTALPLIAILVLVFGVVGGAVSDRLQTQVLSQESSSEGFAPQTIGYRFEVWGEQYIPVLRDYWLAGYGPALPPTIEWRSTESLYLTLVLRGGLALLGAYVVFMVVLFRRATRARRSDDPIHRLLGYVFIGGILALIPMQALFPYFTASGLPQVFWVVLALFATSATSIDPPPVTSRTSRPVGAVAPV
jgi:hypothetical protein